MPISHLTDDRRCVATTKRTQERCQNYAMRGGTVCRFHGGASPRVKQAAQRRLDQAAAATAAHRLGLPRDVEPHVALLEELHRTAGVVAWLEHELAQLDDDLAGRVAHPGYPVWQAERKHYANVARSALDAGVAERFVQLAEAHGALMADVLRRIIDDPELGLTGPQREAMSRAAGRHFRAVTVAG